MPRHMSFSMSTEAVRNRSKTVTRRLGWNDLKPETLLWAVEKGMGLKKGEKVKRLAMIRVVSARDEPLDEMERLSLAEQALEMRREGFPRMTVPEFIGMFVRANHLERETYSPRTQVVNRIEFEYVDGAAL